MAMLSVAPFLVGFAAGLELDFVPYVTSRYFGFRQFGTIYMSLTGLFLLGVGSAPVAVAIYADTTGIYRGALVAGVALSGVAVLLLLSLSRYPDQQKQQGGQG
jgi:MFS family permease